MSQHDLRHNNSHTSDITWGAIPQPTYTLRTHISSGAYKGVNPNCLGARGNAKVGNFNASIGRQ